MKPHTRSVGGRVRRAAKWAGLAACVVIACCWAASFKWELWRGHIRSLVGLDFSSCALRSGGFVVMDCRGDGGFDPSPTRTGVSWDLRPARGVTVNWRPHVRAVGLPWAPEHSFFVIVPLWLPFLCFVFPTAWFWWRDRRGVRPNQCPACGYDLVGLASGAVCPECGAGKGEQMDEVGNGAALR